MGNSDFKPNLMLPPNELVSKFIDDAAVFGVKIGNDIKPNMLTQVTILINLIQFL